MDVAVFVGFRDLNPTYQTIKRDSNSANLISAKLEILRTLDTRLRGYDSHISHYRHSR